MKYQLLLFLSSFILITFSCSSDDGGNSDFDQLLGTYSGAATYSYTGLPNGVLVQNQDTGPASITVSLVSSSEMTFRISGSGLTTEALAGYGDGIYTYDPSKLSSGVYFATNTDNLPSGLREISSRFNLDDSSVEMDYDGRVNDDASVTNISFEGIK